MVLRISRHANKAGSVTGRFLSSFSYVLTTLFVYFVACFITYLALRIGFGPDQGAAFIAYEMATGGDPYNFKELAPAHPVLWVWMLVLHLLSWLIVPVLAATAVDAAYRKWEERRQELDLELRDEIGKLLKAHVGLQEEEANQVAHQLLEDEQKKLANRRKGE